MARVLGTIRPTTQSSSGGRVLGTISSSTEVPQQNLADKIWQNLSQRGENVYSEITKQGQNPIVSGFKATAQAFGGIGDVITDVAKSTPVVGNLTTKLEELAQKGFSSIVDKLSNTQLFKEAAENPESTKKLEDFLNVLSSSGEISGNILAAEGVREGAIKTGETVKQVERVASDFTKSLTQKSEASIEAYILKKFEKGVKPLLPGKTTPTKLADYRDDIVMGVKTIKENKQNLNFTDETGDIISGESPKNLQQMSEALEQTKKSIFNQYDDLAKTAGTAGVAVQTAPIANELESVIGNKALSITNPRAIQYAKDLQSRLLSADSLPATTAQEVIQNYNKALEAFYRNPTYDAASQAAIDAMVANRIRKSLDEGITGLTGKQYQVLKNQYGSLKAIERDVIKASLRDARKNIKGLIDFTDIFSGGQIVNGILSLNPAQVASGLTQKAFAELYKFLNNPNRAIEKLFQEAEKLH